MSDDRTLAPMTLDTILPMIRTLHALQERACALEAAAERGDAGGVSEYHAAAELEERIRQPITVAGRVLDDHGRAVEELVVSCVDPADGERAIAEAGARALQVPLVTGGVINEAHRGPDSLPAAQQRHLISRAELPHQAWRLSEGEAGIPTRHVDVDPSDDATA